MNSWLRVARTIDRMNSWIGRGCAWLAVIMVAIGAYNAIVRYLSRYTGVGLSSNAYIELQWYLFSVLFLLGAAHTLERGGHVRVDVIYAKFSAKARAWIDLVGTILFLIPFTLMAIVVSWPSVRNSWKVLEVSPDPGGLPRYPVKTVILLGFALLLIQGTSQSIKVIARLRGVDTPAFPEDSPTGGEGL